MRDMGWVPLWTDRIQGGAAGAAHNAARLIPIRSKRYEGSNGERIDKMNPIQGALKRNETHVKRLAALVAAMAPRLA
jgi:hypothetical protein